MCSRLRGRKARRAVACVLCGRLRRSNLNQLHSRRGLAGFSRPLLEIQSSGRFLAGQQAAHNRLTLALPRRDILSSAADSVHRLNASRSRLGIVISRSIRVEPETRACQPDSGTHSTIPSSRHLRASLRGKVSSGTLPALVPERFLNDLRPFLLPFRLGGCLHWALALGWFGGDLGASETPQLDAD